MSRRVAVIGSGLIGRSWSMVFARSGCEVSMYDPDPDALVAARSRLADDLAELERIGLIADSREAVARISDTDVLEDALDGAGWVQENAPEVLEIKHELFRRMDAVVPGSVVIASSTSAIPCSAIAKGLDGAGRMVVAHPANPPHLLPIVEVSGGPDTTDETVRHARDFMETIGMAAITIRREMRGFVLNRLQVALLNEAFKLIEDGVVSGEDLDKTVKHGLGLRWSFMGPMETIDLNAPGGIRDYLERFGPAFAQIAGEQSEFRPWTDERYARLEAERRQVMARDELAERARWRDRRLLALVRDRKRAEDELGS